MNLIAKQDEWSDLLEYDTLFNPNVELDDKLFGTLSSEEKHRLAAIWIDDGIHARHPDFPKSLWEVTCMQMSRTRQLRLLYNTTAFIQIISPFFEQRYCRSSETIGYGSLFADGAISRLGLSILDIFFLAVYLFDLYLTLNVNPSSKNVVRKPWTAFRALIVGLIFLDCVMYFCDPSLPRIFRCMYPFLLISRRNNLKLMLQGLLVSSYQSIPVLRALFSLILIWGFIGFFMFRNIDSNPSQFDNPIEGMFSALHCFSSRPFVLKALNPLYAINETSTVYFMTLSMAADILCISLIVAVGSKHYKLFATEILQRRLVDRRTAGSCAFFATAKDGLMSRDSWMEICEHIGGKYKPNRYTSKFIFDFVVASDPRKEESNEASSGPVTPEDGADSSSPRFGDDESEASYSRRTTEQGHLHFLDEFLFFRCCGLIAARIKVQEEKRDLRQSIELFNNNTQSSFKNLLKVFSPRARALSKAQLRKQSIQYPDANTINPMLLRSVHQNNSVTEEAGVERESTFNLSVLDVNSSFDGRERRSTMKVLHIQENREMSVSSNMNSVNSEKKQNQVYSAFCTGISKYYSGLEEFCIKATSANIDVNNEKYNIFSSITVLLHLFVLIHMSFFSHSVRSLAAIDFGWAILILLWVQMIMQIVARGFKRFFTFAENLIDTAINIASFILLLNVSYYYYQEDYDFSMSANVTVYMLFQCARLYKLFFLFNDVEILEHIYPVLIRGTFIYFSVIYFFAVFGYEFFCNALDYDDALNSSENSDASQWAAYQNLLNFRTLLQSIFTLFEMSILGNWSIVMDAAAVSANDFGGQLSAYFFFYTYRLIITLCVLPILVSFIIAAFLSAIGKKEKMDKMKADENRRLRRENGEEDDDDDGDDDDFEDLDYISETDIGRLSSGNRRSSTSHRSSLMRRSSLPPPPDWPSYAGGSEKNILPSRGDKIPETQTLARDSTQVATNGSHAAEVFPLHLEQPVRSQSNDPSRSMGKRDLKKQKEKKRPMSTLGKMKNIRLTFDTAEAYKPKNVALESVTAAGVGNADSGSELGMTNLAPGVSPGTGSTPDSVQVQYDSKMSSMVSLWNVDGSDPLQRVGKGSAPGASKKKGAPKEEVSVEELQLKLQKALHDLEVERRVNKELREK